MRYRRDTPVWLAEKTWWERVLHRLRLLFNPPDYPPTRIDDDR